MTEEIQRHMTRFDRHLRVLRGLSPLSIKAYLRHVDEFYCWLQGRGGEGEAGAVSIGFKRQDLEEFFEHCFYTGNTNVTRASKLTSLRRWIRYLIYEEIMTVDVSASIPSPLTAHKMPQILTQDEVLKLFAAMDINTEIGLRDASMFILGVFCGLRRSEICTLKMNDLVDETDGRGLAVTIRDSKRRSFRTVRLWKQPADVLRRWVVLRLSQGGRGTDWLFSAPQPKAVENNNSRLHISGATLVPRLVVYARKAGVRKHIHPHMLRATHATNLRYIASYDLPAIALRLGHRSVQTTAMRYFATWERVRRTWPSLAAYWREFGRVWDEGDPAAPIATEGAKGAQGQHEKR